MFAQRKYKQNPDFLMPEESLLWRAVLAQAIRDIYDLNENVRKEALRWIMSPDFQIVCDYAFVDPEDMKEQMANLSTLSRSLAKKYGSLLRSEVLSNPDPK